MAPRGSEDDSASTRSSVSPRREAGAARGELVGLLNPFRLAAELVKSHLEAVAEAFEHAGIEGGLRRGLAGSGANR